MEKSMNHQIPEKKQFLTSAAWIIMLAVSMLPDAIFQEITGGRPAWLIWVKISLLAVLIGGSMILDRIRPLRNYIILILAIFAFEEAVSHIRVMSWWQDLFGEPADTFSAGMLSIQSGRLLVTFLMIGTLALLGYSKKDFFLTPGNLKAKIKPVRWLGFPKADPWTSFGGQFAIYISLGTLLFLILAGKPSLSAVKLTLPVIPMILLLAAMNAFSEEMTYRASLLAGLEPVLGYRQSLWITAAFFGIAHYFGVPYGIPGVIMASFLGWMMGKAMLETRGMFWAWLIHFLQDILIFFFMAMGTVVPGG